MIRPLNSRKQGEAVAHPFDDAGQHCKTTPVVSVQTTLAARLVSAGGSVSFDFNAYVANVISGRIETHEGLPDEVFQFLLKISPVPNVDLLVRNEDGENLLAWRVGPWGEGWHVPGGIVRHNELLKDRIREVARLELLAEVAPDDVPCSIAQFVKGPRGHFVSLLYRCRITALLPHHRTLRSREVPRHGDLQWIKGMPDRILPVHEVYRPWLIGVESDGLGHDVVFGLAG